MDAWAEIEALQAQLAAAQDEDASQRLSERNCVELIMKLREMNLVNLHHSTNGKYYLTPSKLRVEVYSAIVAAGGRSTIADISDEVGVNYDLVEEALADIKEDKQLVSYLGNFITQKYIDYIADEIRIMTNQTGFVSIAKISQDYDLSGEFLLEHVQNRSTAKVNPQKTGFYTDSYIKRTSAKVRGFLSAASEPLPVKTLYQRNKQIDETIVSKVIKELLESKRIKGKLVGRGQSATFIPDAYLDLQLDQIRSKIESTGFIHFDELRRGIDAKNDTVAGKWIKENFPDFINTGKHFASPSFIERSKTDLEDNLNQFHMVDLVSIFPDSFSPQDMEFLLRSFSGSSKSICEAETLGSDWLLDGQAIEDAASLFYSVVDERAEKAAAKKIVTIITDNDYVKVDKKSSKPMIAPAPVKGNVSSGGRGAREVKTKGKDKKRKKIEEQAEKCETGGALTDDEILSVLKNHESYEIMDEETLQALLDIILPKLTERYQSQASSIFIKKQQVKNDAKGQRVKSRKEQEEFINDCFTKLKIFHKGVFDIQDSSLQDQLEKFLFKSVGLDLLNAIFAISNESQDTSLSSPMREKILRDLKESDLEAHDALKALNGAKNCGGLLDEAVEAAYCGAQMMIKSDKNREKSTKMAHIANMEETLQSSTDLPSSLHLAVSVLYGNNSKNLLHFSGKFTPKVIDLISSSLEEAQIGILKTAQTAILDELTGIEIDSEVHINALQNLCQK